MQRERRRDPYPWTWEISAAVTIAAVLVPLVGLQLGRSLANLLVGAGWTWPATANSPATPGAGSPLGREFWSSIPAVLTGHAEAGIPGLTAAAAAGPRLLLVCLILTEIALCVAAVRVAVVCVRRWGPGRLRGMATRSEAENILGVTRLRKVAPMVRPDLYGKHASRSTAGPVSRAAETGASATPTSSTQGWAGTSHPVDPADAAEVPVGRGMSPWLLLGRNKK